MFEDGGVKYGALSDSKRPSCYAARLSRHPPASVGPWPIIATASKADCVAPNVAPDSDSARFA